MESRRWTKKGEWPPKTSICSSERNKTPYRISIGGFRRIFKPGTVAGLIFVIFPFETPKNTPAPSDKSNLKVPLEETVKDRRSCNVSEISVISLT
jgi:hypothetical protein